MSILFVLEIFGVVSFAISGAIVGVEKKMDVFGVAILRLTTAVGGILRDLILGITPPSAFQDPSFAVTAIAVSLIVFIPGIRSGAARRKKTYDRLMLLMDSVGLGLFTVVSVQIAREAIPDANNFLVTFVGVLTGIGGGIMRDLFAGHVPNIFVKHFYASASLIGAWICALLWPVCSEAVSMIAGASVTILLRLLAAHYRWSLPTAR